jgi:hypothetical protein
VFFLISKHSPGTNLAISNIIILHNMIVPTFFILTIAAAIANASPAPVPAAFEASSHLNNLVERTPPPASFVGTVTGVCFSSAS